MSLLLESLVKHAELAQIFYYFFIIRDEMISSRANVIIWDEMLSSGANIMIWDQLLSSGMKGYHLELILSSGKKCYHPGLNFIIWD